MKNNVINAHFSLILIFHKVKLNKMNLKNKWIKLKRMRRE